jgi:hypothetical protein
VATAAVAFGLDEEREEEADTRWGKRGEQIAGGSRERFHGAPFLSWNAATLRIKNPEMDSKRSELIDGCGTNISV